MSRLDVRYRWLFALSIAASVAPALAAAPGPAPAPTKVDREAFAAFQALPAAFEDPQNPITDAKVELGRMLFFDPRLSKNQDLSCNSCHALDRYGVDGQKTSSGHKGQKGNRNSPTVYNAGGHVAQFWDGRAATLEEQAKGPVLNPVEMAMKNDKQVITTLKSIPGYVAAFKRAFPQERQAITYANFGKAIGAFERKLVTPSRFDKFLAGDDAALDEAEKRGATSFVSLGCTTCHSGAAVGGSSFQKLGLVKPFDDERDVGRFAVTKDEGDKQKFRVPSLRNIDKTGPYLHDGSVGELTKMIRLMGEHQLGKTLDDRQVTDIVAFLKSLTGTLPAAYVAKPDLPPSGPKTPKPDPS